MERDKQFEELLNLQNQLTAIEKAEAKEHLIDYINYLLLHDFNKLVQILYKVDVDEKKLKVLLQENKETNAAIIIADLLVQRQVGKIETKEAFKSSDDIPDEEKW